MSSADEKDSFDLDDGEGEESEVLDEPASSTGSVDDEEQLKQAEIALMGLLEEGIAQAGVVNLSGAEVRAPTEELPAPPDSDSDAEPMTPEPVPIPVAAPEAVLPPEPETPGAPLSPASPRTPELVTQPSQVAPMTAMTPELQQAAMAEYQRQMMAAQQQGRPGQVMMPAGMMMGPGGQMQPYVINVQIQQPEAAPLPQQVVVVREAEEEKPRVEKVEEKPAPAPVPVPEESPEKPRRRKKPRKKRKTSSLSDEDLPVQIDMNFEEEDEEEPKKEKKEKGLKKPKGPRARDAWFDMDHASFWSSTRRHVKKRMLIRRIFCRKKDPWGGKYKRRENKSYPIRCWKAFHFFWPGACCFVIALLLIGLLPLLWDLPDPKSASIGADVFSGNRARTLMRSLDAQGPRSLGQMVFNTSQALNWVISEVKSRAEATHLLPIPVNYEVVYGDGTAKGGDTFYEGIVSFDNIPSVLAFVRGAYSDAVLVSAQIDSTSYSTGGGAGAQVAMLLEIMGNILNADYQLRHSVLFAFVPGGPTGNIGATTARSNKWFNNVRTFVTLDATNGVDGRLRLQRTTEGASPVARLFGRSFSRPQGNSLTEDILSYFPNQDSRDFDAYKSLNDGDVDGVELAFLTNGMISGTKKDDESAVRPGTLQYNGEGLLRMLRNEKVVESKGYRVFYFDVLSIFLVVLPTDVLMIFSILLFVLIALFAMCGPGMFNMASIPLRTLGFRYLPIGPIAVLHALALAFSLVFSLGFIGVIGTINPNVAWSNGWVAPLLAGGCTLAWAAMTMSLYHSEQLRMKRHPRYAEIFSLVASFLLFGTITAVCAGIDLSGLISLKSTFLPFLWVYLGVGASLFFLVVDRQTIIASPFPRIRRQWHRFVGWDIWMFPRLILSVAVPLIVSIQTMYVLSELLIPLVVHYTEEDAMIGFIVYFLMLVFPMIAICWMIWTFVLNYVYGRGHFFFPAIIAIAVTTIFIVPAVATKAFTDDHPRPIFVSQVRTESETLGTGSDDEGDSRVVISSPLRSWTYSSFLEDVEDAPGQKGFECSYSTHYEFVTSRLDPTNYCVGKQKIPSVQVGPLQNCFQKLNTIQEGTDRSWHFRQTSLCNATSWTMEVLNVDVKEWAVGSGVNLTDFDVKEPNRLTHINGQKQYDFSILTRDVQVLSVQLRLNYDFTSTELQNVLNAFPSWATPYAHAAGYSPFIVLWTTTIPRI